MHDKEIYDCLVLTFNILKFRYLLRKTFLHLKVENKWGGVFLWSRNRFAFFLSLANVCIKPIPNIEHGKLSSIDITQLDCNHTGAKSLDFHIHNLARNYYFLL